MVVYLQNKLFWENIKNGNISEYEELEKFIYTQAAIEAYHNLDFPFDGEEYNTNLHKFYYEVEEYEDEDSYEEIFFQGYIDGDISKEVYFEKEKKFLDFMNYLYDEENTYACYYLDIKLTDNAVYHECTDISFDVEKIIEGNQNDFTKVTDRQFFTDLCYLTGREINSVIFIFTDIKAVLLNSGLHGIILFDGDVNNELIKNLSDLINLEDLRKV